MQTALAERIATRFEERIGAAMSENDFWALIQKIGWKNDKSYRKIKKKLMRKLSPDEANAMDHTFMKLKGRLGGAIKEWIDRGGDLDAFGDSWDDLLSHIVGLGKREYSANLKNPQRAADRYRKGDYYESFAYAVPSAYDYKNLNVGVYIVRAQQAMEAYEDAMKDERFRSVNRQIRKVINALELMSDGNFHAFLKTKDEVESVINDVNKHYQDLARRWDDKDPLPDVGHPWPVTNIYRDVDDYLT